MDLVECSICHKTDLFKDMKEALGKGGWFRIKIDPCQVQGDLLPVR